MKNYSEDAVKKLLTKVGNAGVVKPEVVVDVRVRYSDLDESEVDLLNTLVDRKLLVAKAVDKIILCPKCSSPSVLTKYVCPKCYNVSVVRTRLIQHILCGYTDSEVKFAGKGVMVCPKCGREIRDQSEYRVFATFFECLTCHYRTTAPEIIHICQNCKHWFKPLEANYKTLYAYELSEEAVKLLEESGQSIISEEEINRLRSKLRGD